MDNHRASPAASNPKTIGLKQKDLVGIPWRVAFALQADGWYLRQDIIWAKPNPMPESVTDRCTKAHEYIFLLSKSAKYYYDNEAVKTHGSGCKPAGNKDVFNKGRKGGGYSVNSGKSTPDLVNKRSVWTIPEDEYQQFLQWKAEHSGDKTDVWTVTTKPFKKAHFATFPPKLIEPCILAGCPKGGVVLDPFIGSGTVGFVAKENNRDYAGIDLSKTYIDDIAEQRIKNAQPQLF